MSDIVTLATPILSARLTSTCPHGKRSNQCCGYAEWLQVIHAINRASAETHPEHWIGAPLQSYEQSGGRWFEDYPDFRVILGSDPDGLTNYVQARTKDAADALRAAVVQIVGRDITNPL